MNVGRHRWDFDEIAFDCLWSLALEVIRCERLSVNYQFVTNNSFQIAQTRHYLNNV